ncbi:MAG: 3-dehydroquinate synthase family protein [Candidatus Cryptobacteroides sp.]
MHKIVTGSLDGVMSQVEAGRRVLCVVDRNALEKNVAVAALVQGLAERKAPGGSCGEEMRGTRKSVCDDVQNEAQDGVSREVKLHGDGANVFVMEVSEQGKCMETVQELVAWMLGQGADRDSMLLGIGGGILTDIVGFAAAIYKRGIGCAFVPTTLLAQVDAAIGGKNGVNFHGLKNMLGTIRQPLFTWLSAEVLTSLPPDVWRAGMAEMLKTFIIVDGGNYARAVALFGKINDEICAGGKLKVVLGSFRAKENAVVLAEDKVGAEDAASIGIFDELSCLIEAAAKVKADIVARDECERGERRNLNLGHTFAHAIETLALRGTTGAFHGVTGGRENHCVGAECYDGTAEISHGEAVAMGMVMAAELAEKISGKGFKAVFEHSGAEEEFCCEKGLAERLRTDFEKCGLSVDCPYALSEMAGIMKCDKKAAGGSVRFVLPAKIGKVMTVALRPEDVVGTCFAWR